MHIHDPLKERTDSHANGPREPPELSLVETQIGYAQSRDEAVAIGEGTDHDEMTADVSWIAADKHMFVTVEQ